MDMQISVKIVNNKTWVELLKGFEERSSARLKQLGLKPLALKQTYQLKAIKG